MSVTRVLREARAAESKQRQGCWTARVESVSDPEKLNRVRVRIFQIHGDERQTPTLALPWAEVADVGGGGYDFGSAGRLYPVGSTVWVMFETADEDFPVVIGGRRGKLERDEKNPHEFLTLRGKTESGEKPWLPNDKAPNNNELPKDVFADSIEGDINPTRTVWNKSFKGHTILVEDRDGHEFLRIIDRAGQTIEMDCPVTEDANANNAQQRGTRNAADDTQLSQDVLVNNRGFIRIRDVAGQEIMLDGSANNEQIKIVSRSREGSISQSMVLSSSKGAEKIEITDKKGNIIKFDPNSDIPITIQDSAGDKIEFNVDTGAVLLTSKGAATEVAGSKATTLAGSSLQKIGGDLREQIGGNKFVDIMNDMAATVTGMANAIIGGAVQMQINNAGTSVKDEALLIEAILGSLKMSTKVGDVDLSTLAGDAKLQTTAGNAKLHTDAGNVEASTTLGDAKVHTEAGNIEVTTSAGNLTCKTTAGTAELGSDSLQTTVKGPLGVILGSSAFSIAYMEGVTNALNAIATVLTAPGAFASPIGPCAPAAISALPGLLSALTAPGVLGSIFNKTA